MKIAKAQNVQNKLYSHYQILKQNGYLCIRLYQRSECSERQHFVACSNSVNLDAARLWEASCYQHGDDNHGWTGKYILYSYYKFDI